MRAVWCGVVWHHLKCPQVQQVFGALARASRCFLACVVEVIVKIFLIRPEMSQETSKKIQHLDYKCQWVVGMRMYRSSGEALGPKTRWKLKVVVERNARVTCGLKRAQTRFNSVVKPRSGYKIETLPYKTIYNRGVFECRGGQCLARNVDEVYFRVGGSGFRIRR